MPFEPSLIAAASIAGATAGAPAADAPAVPFSGGRGAPSVRLPAAACDCHVHVYDSRYAAVPGAALTPPDASAADLRRLQQRIGTQRTVLVTPSTYGTDNRAMLDGLAALGAAARGVAVLDLGATDAELQRLHAAGVRGLRFNLSLAGWPDASQLRPMAERIAPLGWHIQLLAPPPTLLQLAPVLRSLPVPVVFDHLARIAPEALGGEAHRLVLGLLDAGRAWVKLSGGYLVSDGHRVDHPGLLPLARSYLQAAPGRCVWGSDWPHATASAGRHAWPDDALQVDTLAAWAGDDATLRRVLVDNPARLYHFDPVPGAALP